MDTKLTLKLDQKIIEKAKIYAAEQKLSLSYIIEHYLQALTSEKKDQSKLDISPFVKSLSTGVKLPADLDIKKEYGDYLTNKYK